jgi:hypothetical protein
MESPGHFVRDLEHLTEVVTVRDILQSIHFFAVGNNPLDRGRLPVREGLSRRALGNPYPSAQ